jgi:hypothetical protein
MKLELSPELLQAKTTRHLGATQYELQSYEVRAKSRVDAGKDNPALGGYTV